MDDVESYEIIFKGHRILIDCDDQNDRIVLAVQDEAGECVAAGIIILNEDNELDETLN